MKTYSLIAPAKINLYLEIIGDLQTNQTTPGGGGGYHELVMILQSIGLADRIEISANGTQEFKIHCNHPQVPINESNLAYKAAKLMATEFADAFANYGGMDITIEKNIPVAAGLAGGSTDAAAVFVGINLIWKLGLTQPELQVLAAKIGSDIPFCLSGGTAIATGRGEQLDPLTSPHHLAVVLAKYKNISVSTAWAYTSYRQQFHQTYITDIEAVQSRTYKVHSSPLVSAIVHKKDDQLGKLLHNDLEKVVLPEFPQVAKLKAAFERSETLGTMMSGSGPTVFALCQSQTQAQQVKQEVEAAMADPDLEFWITHLSDTGIGLQ